MRVGVVGAGSLGTLLAGLLARVDGVEAWLVTRRPEIVDHVDRHGVAIHDQTTLGEPVLRSRPGALVADEASCRVAGTGLDAVLLLTSAADAPWAVEVASRLVRPDGLVVSLQNGLAAADAVEAWGDGGVAGTTYHGATALSLGEVAWTMRGTTTLAPRASARDRAEALASAVRSDELAMAVSADRDGVLWAKLSGALTNAVSGALLVPVHEVLASEPAMAVVARAQAELLAVAEARGIELAPPSPPSAPSSSGASPAAGAPPPLAGSAYQALVAGRPDEVGDTVGDVVAAGRAVGVPTPVCEALALLVAARRTGRPGTGAPTSLPG